MGEPSAEPPASTVFGPVEADRTLELLYDDGTERHGSLLFLDYALKLPSGQSYTIAETAEALGVTPEEARAYRRNLGRALAWIHRNEIESLPDIFDYWKEGDSWRYQVIPAIRDAAERRGGL